MTGQHGEAFLLGAAPPAAVVVARRIPAGLDDELALGATTQEPDLLERDDVRLGGIEVARQELQPPIHRPVGAPQVERQHTDRVVRLYRAVEDGIHVPSMAEAGRGWPVDLRASGRGHRAGSAVVTARARPWSPRGLGTLRRWRPVAVPALGANGNERFRLDSLGGAALLRELAGATAFPPHQPDRADQHDRDRDPVVARQAEVALDRVDAQHLDPAAADPVADQVDEQQRPAPFERAGTIEPQDDADQRQVPQRFVQERRMEGRPSRVTGALGDAVTYGQGPRQVGGLPEQLLVEVVA